MNAVTAMAGESPRIRMDWGTNADGLGAVLRAALDLLAGGGRIRLVRDGEAADIVHTVSGAGAAARADGTPHRVHTVQAVPLRPGRTLPAWWWGRREGRRVGASTTWLAHGRVAAQLLVASRAVPGERVHWLPIVAPLECRAGDPVDRAAVRAQLGVPPGAVLVLECASQGGPDTVGGWARLLGADRPDVMALSCVLPRAGTRSPARPGERRAAPRAPHPTAFPSFPELLAAADLFVAGRRALTAANPGVAALAAGVPVIAVTTDSTAELVRSGRNGFVVPPDPAAVAEAVHAYLAGELPHGRARVTTDGDRSAAGPRTTGPRTADPVLEEFARGLLRAYHCALAHHGGPHAADRAPDRRTDRDSAGGPDPVPAG